MAEFPVTRWTLLQHSMQDGTQCMAALEELCRMYRGPVLAAVGAWPALHGAAEDLTQEFLAEFVAGGAAGRAEKARGTFRAYLSGALRHFLLNAVRRSQAARRGGGHGHVSLDEAEEAGAVDAWPEMEARLDAAWATRVWEHALAAARREWDGKPGGVPFARLSPYLSGGEELAGYREAAAGMGLSVDQMKRRVGELRRLLRAAMREEVARTAPAEDVDGEMRYLMELLARR
jgi:DNA-directed RNA polymerase specialized sigma24 family protein